MSALKKRTKVYPEYHLNQFVVDDFETSGGKKVRVVRDDYFIERGGTKRRTLEAIMPKIKKGEIVYSATPYGYGQVAIAHACYDFNKSATIFTPKVDLKSDFHLRAADLGANIREVELKEGESFNKVTEAAEEYARRNIAVRHLMKSGFDSEEFSEETAKLIKKGLPIDDAPKEVWCVAGSGALSRSLQKVWPDAKHYVVRVRSQDSIYGVDCDPGIAEVYDAKESFSEVATIKPPFTSSENYDAKLWSHVLDKAQDGALVWNM